MIPIKKNDKYYLYLFGNNEQTVNQTTKALTACLPTPEILFEIETAIMWSGSESKVEDYLLNHYAA